MPSCGVPGCYNRTMKRKMYMACFPSDLKRKEIWINNIGEIGWKPTKYSRVCEVSNPNRFFCIINIKMLTAYKIFNSNIFQMKCGRRYESMESEN